MIAAHHSSVDFPLCLDFFFFHPLFLCHNVAPPMSIFCSFVVTTVFPHFRHLSNLLSCFLDKSNPPLLLHLHGSLFFSKTSPPWGHVPFPDPRGFSIHKKKLIRFTPNPPPFPRTFLFFPLPDKVCFIPMLDSAGLSLPKPPLSECSSFFPLSVHHGYSSPLNSCCPRWNLFPPQPVFYPSPYPNFCSEILLSVTFLFPSGYNLFSPLSSPPPFFTFLKS